MRADRPPDFVGVSRHAIAVRAEIARLGPLAHPVVIAGETGAGKDVVARALHLASGRAGAYVQVAGKEIAPSLLHSTLYGHERGAFSGAVDRQLGLIERALGGTFFLDELGDVSKRAQGSMLGLLEGRSLRRLGGTRDLILDVRFLVGTQRDLEDLVRAGRLREDFAHRLGFHEIRLLPLRERLEDLDSLVSHVLERAAVAARRGPVGLDPEVLDLFRAYRWPGNVRELEMVLCYAAELAGEGEITMAHLPRRFLRRAGCMAEARAAGAARRADGLAEVLREEGGNLTAAGRRLGVNRKTVRRWARDRRIDVRAIKTLGDRRP